MDPSLLIVGLVLGSCITSALIWFHARSQGARSAYPDFSSVAQSVVVTAIVAGIVRVVADYFSLGAVTMAGVVFGTGWMLGGLLAGWFLTGPMRRR
jgi:Na+/phosphate symporter